MIGRAGRARGLALAMFLCAHGASERLAAQVPPDLGTVVPALMREYGVPGAAVVVVNGDSVVFRRGFGFAQVAGSVPFDAEQTSFRLASVAKLFVATVVTGLATKGELDLSRDIRAYVPEIPLAGPFEEPITLHHLLTHTAGLDERIIGYAAESRAGIRPLGEYLTENLPPRGWAVGEVVGYSNHGMALAAYVAERVTGTPFDRLAEEELFGPLGMANTRYLDPPAALEATRAVGHLCVGGGEDRDGSLECTEAREVYSHPYPVGLAFSTVVDMERFLRAQLNRGTLDGTDVLDSRAVAAVQRERYTPAPGLPGMSYGFFNQPLRGHGALTHAGSVPGIRTLLVLVPDQDLGFFFATNGGDSGFGEALRDSIAARFLPAASPADPRPPRVAVPTDVLERLAGIYQMTRYPHRTVAEFSMRFGTTATVWVDETAGPGFSFDGRSYAPVDSLRFREVGGDRLLQFEVDERTGRIRLFAGAAVFGAELPAAYEQLPWYGEPRFLNEYLSYLLGLPLIALILVWPGMALGGWWIRRRMKTARTRAVADDGGRAGAALSLALPVLFFSLFAVFGLGFIARATRMFAGSTGIVFGMTPGMEGLLWIPWALGVLAAAMGGACVLAWRRRYWGGMRRGLYSLLTFGALLAVQFLVQWNYLPPRW